MPIVNLNDDGPVYHALSAHLCRAKSIAPNASLIDMKKSGLCDNYKKLSYRRGTARCVVSIEILPIATQQCRNYYTTSSDQIDGMKLEI